MSAKKDKKTKQNKPKIKKKNACLHKHMLHICVAVCGLKRLLDLLELELEAVVNCPTSVPGRNQTQSSGGAASTLDGPATSPGRQCSVHPAFLSAPPRRVSEVMEPEDSAAPVPWGHSSSVLES